MSQSSCGGMAAKNPCNPKFCAFCRGTILPHVFFQKRDRERVLPAKEDGVCVCVCVYIYIYLYVMYIFIFTKVYVLYVEREGKRESLDHPRCISTQELICSKHEHELLVQLQVKSR